MYLLKPVFTTLALIIICFGCNDKSKQLNEDYQAIGFISKGKEILLSDNLYMKTHRIHYILFTYHDSIFEVIMKKKKFEYRYCKLPKKIAKLLQQTFDSNSNTNLEKQLKNLAKNGPQPVCGGAEGYFLKEKKGINNFGLFSFTEFINFAPALEQYSVPIKKSKFPPMFKNIYHTLNSKQWEYYMSDNYYHKGSRTFTKQIQ